MPKFLSTNEVADRLQVSHKTVINLINRGKFPGAHKIDPEKQRSSYRIPEQEVKDYIDKLLGDNK
jgi:excisionase family DNA binding protein